MSAPIKPPGGPPKPPPDEAGRVGDVQGPGRPSEAFRRHVEATPEVGPSAPVVAGSAVLEVARSLAEDLRSGRIDAAGAVDTLVARAMGSGAAAVLSPAQRAELEAFLRRSLADDPALVALTEELDRGV